MHLEELPMDIGYASEKVSVKNSDGNTQIICGQNGKTQLFITLPFVDEDIKKELQAIEKELPECGEHEVTAALIFANGTQEDLNLSRFERFVDDKGEFGDFYGVRLSGEPYDGQLTKAIILISKDGAIFYDEFVKDLGDFFNQEILMRKIFAAQTCYTGKGCH